MTAPKTAKPPIKKRPGVRSLRTPADIKRLLAKLIKARVNGDDTIDNSTLRVINQSCQVLLKSIEVGDFAKQLDLIQVQLDEFSKKRGV